MSYVITWSEQSKADLQSIYDFIAQDSVYYAEIEIIKIVAATDILVSHVYAGKVVPELEIENIREIIHGNYRIIYKIIDAANVSIITVHHGARFFAK